MSRHLLKNVEAGKKKDNAEAQRAQRFAEEREANPRGRTIPHFADSVRNDGVGWRGMSGTGGLRFLFGSWALIADN